MFSVDLLEEAIQVAKDSGFEVRHEWLSESVGGACRIGQRRVLYVDLSLTAEEQLEQVVTALRNERQMAVESITSSALRDLLLP
ncbi:MAG: hypothetical protein KDB22_25420 [Planctomycetales bacterium]|nr:hypothetical protein [Planctomycetales bacterium]